MTKKNENNWISAVVSVFLVGVIGSITYINILKTSQSPERNATSTSSYAIEEQNLSNYSCTGKVYCSEMTSCAEARFYQRNCPGTKMDGDGDGIPCESQWCGW